MKKLIEIFMFALFIFAFAMHFSSAQFPQPSDSYVNDFVGIFSAAEVANLRSILTDVNQATTAEVVVVSVQTAKPLTPSEYAIQLGQAWGIGKEDKDNGLVILYAAEEKKIFVATGYGLEGILPDSKIGRMLDEYYVPLRDSGNVGQGILRLQKRLLKLLKKIKMKLFLEGKPAVRFHPLFSI